MSATLVSDLSSFPEPARALVLDAIGAAGPDDPALSAVVGHHLDLDGDLATAHLVLPSALVRVQVRRDGAFQRTVVPTSELLRVDELFQDGTLTVVVELNADRSSISVVAYAIEGRFEGEGALTRGGWVLSASGPAQARLATFAASLRALLVA